MESPKKAITIGKILGDEYIVRATMGHIMDLDKGRSGNIGVNIEKGFVPKYVTLKDKIDKIQAIVAAAKGATEIYIATDNDREGEAIGFHIADKLPKDKPTYRVKFVEITKKAIFKAIENPTELNKNIYDAQQARRVVDRIVGFTVSPYLYKKYNENLSAGRVQSVALRLITDREQVIEEFVPEHYFNIFVKLKKGRKTFSAKFVEKVIIKEEAESIADDLRSDEYIVTNVNIEQKLRPPPPPLITSKMQQEALVKFKYSPAQTMRLAQSLYESGFVSYIRTDSVRSSEESIAEARSYIQQANQPIPDKPNIFSAKSSAQDAHEAIRPTNVFKTPDKLPIDKDQRNLYHLIWARFVASQATNVVIGSVRVKIKTKKNYELVAEGKTIEDLGWMVVADCFAKKPNNVTLPELKTNDQLKFVSLQTKEESTKPPSRFNEATLVDELEKKGVGRPSTYAAIIDRLKRTNYTNLKKNYFYPTETGRKVCDDLKSHFSFMNIKYTSQMEKKLDLISEGKDTYINFMTEFFKEFQGEFREARNSDQIDAEIPCPLCGSKTVVRHSRFGYFAGCINYPKCRGTVGIIFENGKVVKHIYSDLVEGYSCPKCGSGMVRRDGEYGPFLSCYKYPHCKGKRRLPIGKKCSKCGSDMSVITYDGNAKLACMNYPNCKNLEDVPDDVEINWIVPNDIKGTKYKKRVERALNSKVDDLKK